MSKGGVLLLRGVFAIGGPVDQHRKFTYFSGAQDVGPQRDAIAHRDGQVGFGEQEWHEAGGHPARSAKEQQPGADERDRVSLAGEATTACAGHKSGVRRLPLPHPRPVEQRRGHRGDHDSRLAQVHLRRTSNSAEHDSEYRQHRPAGQLGTAQRPAVFAAKRSARRRQLRSRTIRATADSVTFHVKLPMSARPQTIRA